ncbi:MAG TPA: DNA gyrase inhibitor YacG [bacterium]|nr:DNA gyrase inhibitor YacG [bacterium]
MNAKCPKCAKPTVVDQTNPTRPFCSDRCRMLDLGGWLSGEYAIPGEPVVDETEPGDEDEPRSRH